MKRDEILKQIEETDEQIRMFQKRLKTSDLCEELYDSAILQKAVLIRQLQDYGKNPIIEKFKKLMPKKNKTLICDYFNT